MTVHSGITCRAESQTSFFGIKWIELTRRACMYIFICVCRHRYTHEPNKLRLRLESTSWDEAIMAHGCVSQAPYTDKMIWKLFVVQLVALNRGGSWYSNLLTGWRYLAGSGLKTEEDHLHIWKVGYKYQLCYCIMPHSSLSNMGIWDVTVINLRSTCVPTLKKMFQNIFAL